MFENIHNANYVLMVLHTKMFLSLVCHNYKSNNMFQHVHNLRYLLYMYLLLLVDYIYVYETYYLHYMTPVQQKQQKMKSLLKIILIIYYPYSYIPFINIISMINVSISLTNIMLHLYICSFNPICMNDKINLY